MTELTDLLRDHIIEHKEISGFCLYAPKRNNNIGFRYCDRLVFGLVAIHDYPILVFDDAVTFGAVDEV